jgi:hypothetical protein
MNKLIPIAFALAFAGSPAFAQDSTSPSTKPAIPTSPPAATMPAPSTSPPAATMPATPAPGATTTMAPSDKVKLTDEQARVWLRKPIYSSDGKSIGQVAAFTRDSSGNITELHADIGGFLGLGASHVRMMPGQFSMGTDRINTSLTAEQAKALPKVPQ